MPNDDDKVRPRVERVRDVCAGKKQTILHLHRNGMNALNSTELLVLRERGRKVRIECTRKEITRAAPILCVVLRCEPNHWVVINVQWYFDNARPRVFKFSYNFISLFPSLILIGEASYMLILSFKWTYYNQGSRCYIYAWYAYYFTFMVNLSLLFSRKFVTLISSRLIRMTNLFKKYGLKLKVLSPILNITYFSLFIFHS